MTDKTIELIADTDEELQEKLAAAVADTIDEVLNEMLLRVFERSQQNLIDPMPWEGRAGKSVIFDTGNLMRSGELDVKDRFVKRITYKAFYADMVEFGTPPHMPPEAPIRAWCRRKLGLKGKELEAAVEGIKWKIYHEGVEPHPFLRPSIKEILG